MFKAYKKEWLRRIEHGGWVLVICIGGTCLGFLRSKLKSLWYVIYYSLKQEFKIGQMNPSLKRLFFCSAFKVTISDMDS